MVDPTPEEDFNAFIDFVQMISYYGTIGGMMGLMIPGQLIYPFL